MASENLIQVFESEAESLGDELDSSMLDRILIEPHQEALAEAIAADVVDVAPIVGDLLAGVRKERAENQGIDRPDSPAYIENALGDIPKPVDTIADVVVSQNVLLYLQRQYGLEIADDFVAINKQGFEGIGDLIDSTTPD